MHPRRDDIIDFARGTARIRVGGNDYKASVVVGNRRNAGLLLYDIIDLTPISIPTSRKIDTSYIARDLNSQRDRQDVSVGNNITLGNKAVKNLGGIPDTARALS